MDEFLEDIFELLDRADLDTFKDELLTLINHYSKYDSKVTDIGDIIWHNYNCHKYNRTDALIKSLEEFYSIYRRKDA
jgi:hypothetical protein